jgi:predicted glycoside hydrolase/deacetylase ChbG (UPF0249 family)
MTARRLIVNADDFGRSRGINRGIATAHQRGIVTSASLMVRQPAAQDAAALAHEMPRLGVGLHIDLSEWRHRDGDWVQTYSVADEDDPSEVLSESRQQLALFRSLMGRDPSHIDSHQHVHRGGAVRSILADMASEVGVPLRSVTPGIEYRGDYHGQTASGEPLPSALTVEALAIVLRSLAPGTNELGCHPAMEVDFDSAYGEERLVELDVLCSTDIRSVLESEQIRLVSFDQL